MFTRKCEICGMEFQTASNRAKYCVYVYCKVNGDALDWKYITEQCKCQA